MKTIAKCMTAVSVAACVGLAGPASATVPQAGRIGMVPAGGGYAAERAHAPAWSLVLGGGSGALAPQAQDADECGIGMPPTSATAAEQQQMLDLHNALRAKHGVPPLTWDDTLAACAQDWTNERARTDNHPAHRPDTRYGENTYNAWGGDADNVGPQGAMGFWGGEEAKFDSATGQCKPGTTCGHFIQVVSSQATKIGCGKTAVADRPQPGVTEVYWTCNYAPWGSFGAPTGDSSPAPQNGDNDPAPLDSDINPGQ